MRHEANTTCTCKRGNCPSQTDAVCKPELYAGHEKAGVLFVTHREDLHCPHLRSYSYGDFCVSIERIEEYLQRGAEALRTGRHYVATAANGLRSQRFVPAT
jgi:hypothetical protein